MTADLGPVEIVELADGRFMARRTVDGYRCHGNAFSTPALARRSLAKVVRATREVSH